MAVKARGQDSLTQAPRLLQNLALCPHPRNAASQAAPAPRGRPKSSQEPPQESSLPRSAHFRPWRKRRSGGRKRGGLLQGPRPLSTGSRAPRAALAVHSIAKALLPAWQPIGRGRPLERRSDRASAADGGPWPARARRRPDRALGGPVSAPGLLASPQRRRGGLGRSRACWRRFPALAPRRRRRRPALERVPRVSGRPRANPVRSAARPPLSPRLACRSPGRRENPDKAPGAAWPRPLLDRALGRLPLLPSSLGASASFLSPPQSPGSPVRWSRREEGTGGRPGSLGSGPPRPPRCSGRRWLSRASAGVLAGRGLAAICSRFRGCLETILEKPGGM